MTDTVLATKRSTFVSVVAWISIVLSGFATVGTLVQSAAMVVIFESEGMQSVTREMESYQDKFFLRKFLFDNPLILFSTLSFPFVLALIASIGLLRRRNWGRIIFIGYLILGIAWSIALIVFPQFLAGASIGFPIAFTLLFAWVIAKLVSADIRREFQTGQTHEAL